jgi:3-oxoacyl-[acyl-carrier-protein] synthase III
VCLPAGRRTAQELFVEEGAAWTPEAARRLGIREVPLCKGETGSELALAACRQALERAGVAATELQAIIDYTILPQEYLVPAWNMSNKLQHELGATNAFTVGFSGGGASNFVVALSGAAAMLESDASIKNILMVAGDVTIPGNRVLHPDDPVTVMGDGASAVVVQRGASSCVVSETELWSDGANHDVCCIPGGALAHPASEELYRVVLDKARYDAAPKYEMLARMAQEVLERAGIRAEDVRQFVYPDLSSEDRGRMQAALGFQDEQMSCSNLAARGHLQGNDLAANFLAATESGELNAGDAVLMGSHGMGFLYGVSLLRM